MTLEMDNGIAYITLPAAQNFIDMPDGYSGVLISLKNRNRLDETMLAVESVVCSRESVDDRNDIINCNEQNATDYAVLSWHFTMERLLQTGESNNAFGIMMMYILYLIVGFGILGTIIMMTNERKREFSVMISLGMSRRRLAMLVSMELFTKSLMGALIAVVVTVPIVLWFQANPIQMWGDMAETYVQFGLEPLLPMSAEPSVFINQIITILIISVLAAIYPVRKILKLSLSKNK
jgi:ABC-type lipoprotein release transport system permease subunit